MKSKGEVNMILIGGLIGLAILVFVLIFLFFKSGAGITLLNYFKNIPGFGQNQIPTTPFVEVRYDIPNDAVQYYDGTKWQFFSKDGTANVGGKTLEASNLQTAFSNYYFSKSSRSSLNIYSDGTYSVDVVEVAAQNSPEAVSLPSPTVWDWLQCAIGNCVTVALSTADAAGNIAGKLLISSPPSYSKGAIIEIVTKNKQSFGLIFVEPDGTPKFAGTMQDSTDKVLNMGTISANTLKWSVSTPIPVAYNSQADKFCAIRVGTKIVIQDLNEPAKGNACLS